MSVMADGVDIDLYAEDLEQDFTQEFAGESVDLYDDVIASATSQGVSNGDTAGGNNQIGSSNHVSSNGNQNNTLAAKRFQLYVGNLTWWTTDQDVTDAVHFIGVNDFLDVKFFENRTNGQSKGFCVITLASENSMRLCMERLPKREMHGQHPAVTYTTKQALAQFESQSKTRATPPPAGTTQPRPQTAQPQHNLPRMMMAPQQQMRGRMPPPGMQSGPPQSGPRMPAPPGMVPGMVPPNASMQSNQGPPPGFHQGNWNGSRPILGPRPGMPPQGMPPQQRGPMMHGMQFQGPPPGQGMPRGPPPQGPPQMVHGDPRGPRPDWNRPPGGPHQQGFPGHQQVPPGLQGMIPGQNPMNRGPMPGQMVHPVHVMPQSGNQGPHQNHPPQGQMQPQQHPGFMPPNYNNQGGGPHVGPPNGPFGTQPVPRPNFAPEAAREASSLNDQEFEDIMGRNRAVSSSAITRAVQDAAAGEYASSIETLVTAISLIKQSKVAGDDRCKILISSLQDTLRGIEAKSYGHRRERSRSRDRERSHHRRSRRERTRSRERDYRSRERDRGERDRDRYYAETYSRGDRSRSRERERDREREYRERSREDSSARVNIRSRLKSPPDGIDPAAPTSVVSSSKSGSRYYEDRYRDRERDRDRDRDRERERERHVDRDRDRDRREERAESSHRTSRH